MVSLFDNWTHDPVTVRGSTLDFEFALEFTTTADLDANALRYWYVSSANNRPTNLYLWDLTANAQVAHAVISGPPALDGWTDCPVTPFTLTAGHSYQLLYQNTYNANVLNTDENTTDSDPLVFGTVGYRLGETSSVPLSGAYVEHPKRLLVDIAATVPTGGGGGGLTTGDVDALLQGWLDNDSAINAHQSDGLPWLTKAQSDAIKTIVDSIATGVGNIPKAGDSDWTTIRKLWQIAGALTDAEIAAWNLFAKRAPTQLTGVGGQGGSAFFGGHGTQVADNAETLVERQTLMLSTFPASPWALIDTTTFDTSLAWDVDADLYTVSFSDTGSAIVNTLASGVDVCYRLAWWAPLNGANGYQRGFIDFPTAHCYYGGQRMPGIVLFSAPGGVGTVEAWRYA